MSNLRTFIIPLFVQLTTLQGDFDQLKNEYDTLLALHQNESMKSSGRHLETMQVFYIYLIQ